MKVVYCPANAWDCPYWKKDGTCSMYPEDDPIKECDDFAHFWEEGEDYVCDTDEDYELMEYEAELREKENLREWEIYEEIHRQCNDDCGFDPYLGCYTDDC